MPGRRKDPGLTPMMLIIAWGNPLRRDDGAGLRLGEMLERLWRERDGDVLHIAVHQLTPELAEDVARDDVSGIVFTDARVISAEGGNAQPGIRVHPLSAKSRALVFGHGLDPATIMACVRLLYHKAPPVWLATVPGVDFNHGEGLSETAEKALSSIPERLRDLGKKTVAGAPVMRNSRGSGGLVS
ncbi:hydrogenase maturation protease [Desulfococcus multivorans]|jgi:hydrogenase maturation protease|uniref:Hydrogenase maturation protease n=2 Tax=Desulfococcus TaxID=896 RepID=S7TXV1_DESML|nr:hydrogenase maturation protease [Desulfococcus multivorans]EPR41882.1 hydrogenase maturation protease [Desulfococcus multivorans DSM 2059]MDX9820249.1 hydrogenase maturation protease [Desulfococcus multivorans]SJZ93772.1 hydrogenase maturation protease [Desulfococcus multivorans DSM 2059]